jgi:hypothetical protein
MASIFGLEITIATPEALMADEHPRQLLSDTLAKFDRAVKLDRFETR